MSNPPELWLGIADFFGGAATAREGVNHALLCQPIADNALHIGFWSAFGAAWCETHDSPPSNHWVNLVGGSERTRRTAVGSSPDSRVAKEGGGIPLASPISQLGPIIGPAQPTRRRRPAAPLPR